VKAAGLTVLGEPILDMAVVADLSELDQEEAYFMLLFDVFSADARATLQRLRDLAACGETGVVAREAHRLRGSSGSIGATRLAAGLRAIDKCARGGELEKLKAHIARSIRILDLTIKAVRRLPSRLPPAVAKGPFVPIGR
jgi:HPt (histidine-containing phosphotransfer) domain-containing protein